MMRQTEKSRKLKQDLIDFIEGKREAGVYTFNDAAPALFGALKYYSVKELRWWVFGEPA